MSTPCLCHVLTPCVNAMCLLTVYTSSCQHIVFEDNAPSVLMDWTITVNMYILHWYNDAAAAGDDDGNNDDK